MHLTNAFLNEFVVKLRPTTLNKQGLWVKISMRKNVSL